MSEDNSILTSWRCRDDIRDAVSFLASHSRTAIPRAGVRFSDSGSEGYVITRTAARHLLDTTPKMVLSTDHAVLRYWANGLNVFYVDPPVVHHGGYEDTFIGTRRTASRRLRAEADYTVGFWRRTVTGVSRSVQKHLAFRRLVLADQRNAALPLARRG